VGHETIVGEDQLILYRIFHRTTCKTRVLDKQSVFGDKGYISSELGKVLLEKGIQLITKLKSNMKNKLMPLIEKVLLASVG
jgi:hypothetical protein